MFSSVLLMKRIKDLLRKIPKWLLSIVTVIAIGWLTLMPRPLGDIEPPLFPGADKVVHAIMFGFLAAMLILDRWRHHGRNSISTFYIIITAIASASLGILVEYAQQWMHMGRSFDSADIVADIAGVLLTTIVASIYFRRKKIWKTLLGIVIAICILPFSIYIPPVQKFVTKVACDVVKRSTGMDITIGELRLRFPLDVTLNDLKVIDANRDTMAIAKRADVDLQLRPLLNLDLKVKKLKLTDGYYRMLSSDSSMLLKLHAGMLETDNRAELNIAKSLINLNKATIENGNISLYMDMAKQQPTPTDTTTLPFIINANELTLRNITFAMSMRPTIDTLSMRAKMLTLQNGSINLRTNKIHWRNLTGDNGSVLYLIPPTPTNQTANSNTVAENSTAANDSATSAPMEIRGDNISLNHFSVLYATKGAKPQPGFDPSYIALSDVSTTLKDFYNSGSNVVLPITSIEGRERCGLQITSGSGTVSINETGIKLDRMDIHTLYSSVSGNLNLPFAMMELKPNASTQIAIKASLGLSDIESFMPTMKSILSVIPNRAPINLNLEADGSLSDIKVKLLNVAIGKALSIAGTGRMGNLLNMKRLFADIRFRGDLANPNLLRKFADLGSISIPKFKIEGTAHIANQNYDADFQLQSPAGSIAAKGSVGLNSERYKLDASLKNINAAYFMPDLGIGRFTGSVKATGAGFNPLSGTATTLLSLDVANLEYRKKHLSDIRADISLLKDGTFNLNAVSDNTGLNLDIEGSGIIHKDDYTLDMRGNIRDLDLAAFGLSDTQNNGTLQFTLAGNINPKTMDLNLDFTADQLDWNFENSYLHLPQGVQLHAEASEFNTLVDLKSQLTSLHFQSEAGINRLTEIFSKISTDLEAQIKRRDLQVDKLSETMPRFKLDMAASGRGLMRQLLTPYGMSVDTIYGHLSHDSLITGEVATTRFTSQSINLDTIRLTLGERRNLLDYKLHIGNRPGTLDQFAEVNLNGYIGANRAGAFLTQRNIQRQMGYRLGLTAAMADSVMTFHFTPLRSTIAYLPWELNEDNYVDYNPYTRKVHANLLANSKESEILLRTETNNDGLDELHLRLDHIKIQDFLSLSVFAPPITGCIDTDLRLLYTGSGFTGSGHLDMHDFTYDQTRVGDFNMNLKAGMNFKGNTDISATMQIDGKPAATAYAILRSDSVGFKPDSVGLRLTQFPLSVINPFMEKNAVLTGGINGEMQMQGTFTKPILNGSLWLDSVSAYVPIAGTTIRFDKTPVIVESSNILFKDFNLWAANRNPLRINGNINASDLSNILIDMGLDGKNVQLIGNDRKARSDLYGKLFIDLNGTARGSMNRLDVRGNLNILGTTDLTYNNGATPSQLTSVTQGDVVKFVNFNDTTQVAQADSLESSLAMRIRAGLTVSAGTKVTVLLTTNPQDRVELQPTANLNYYQNYMGDMRLNGTLTTGSGFARYSVPVLGEKMFSFNPSSSITWGGDLMNPTLALTAYDNMKANVSSDGSSRLVNFVVTLNATGQLANPNINFDLSTTDDMTIQNELQAMSSDQRQTQAMNLLLYGQYTGQNTKTIEQNLGSSMLYGFLEAQVNQWAARAIKGVDLSFGIDQFNNGSDGINGAQTSYSYQVSKSLFNNRFKIQVGGNYSTDSSPDENLGENLISDVSVEYILKQSQNSNMALKLFRHMGYESILEGEITETGVGFVMKRKLLNLLNLFSFGKGKDEDETVIHDVEETPQKNQADTLQTTQKEVKNEK